MELKCYEPGEFFYHYEEKCKHVYIILDGLLGIWEPKEDYELEKEMSIAGK